MNIKPICLIVGAGDYIGAAIAKRFADGGYHVVMGRRHSEKFAPLISEIKVFLLHCAKCNQNSIFIVLKYKIAN